MLLTIVAFIVALGLLIAVHEYGHYRVAVACAVSRCCASRWVSASRCCAGSPRARPRSLSWGPSALGGYVRMLDEREAPVPADERHLAFNTQPLCVSRSHRCGGALSANLLLASAAVFHRQLERRRGA